MINKLISYLLITCFLSSCSLVNSIRLRNANDDVVPSWLSSADTSPIETEYHGEKPYIFAEINGVKGFKLLVDTGASITILQDTPKVKELQLKRGYELTLSGWGDEESSPAYQAQLTDLKIGDALYKDVSVGYLPVTQTKYFLRADEAVYDGVIGHDLMHHFSWIFDKRANQITIDRAAYQADGTETELAIDTFLSKLYIDSTIDLGQGQKFEREVIIDTGSRHYVKLNNTYIKDNELRLPGKSITAVDFGLSGRAVHQRIRLPEFQMGNQVFKNTKANLIHSDEDDDYWIIGSALLNQYISIVDYHSEKLFLKPYPGHEFKTRFNLIGLELRKIRSGEFVVRYVFPDTNTAKQDIKEGDLITQINGIDASEISLERWLEFSAKPQQFELCRKRKVKKCMQMTSEPIKGYSAP